MQEITIDAHLQGPYREYVDYALKFRGIPSKYDSLTPVQRMILMNVPEKLHPTLNLIGSCISSGYHHGDDSLDGAINKLTRSFDNSISMINGSGFFGNGISGASAPRYTKCRTNPKIKELIKKFESVNDYDLEGIPPYFRLDVPLGLCTFIVGIAPGYLSQILPRKFEEIQKYLDGEKADLTPYFQGFKGTITKNNHKSWVITSTVTFDEKTREIKIIDLPPMMRYDTFLENRKSSKEDIGLKKPGLSEILDKVDFNYISSNNSKTFVDITIKCRTNDLVAINKLVEQIKALTRKPISENFLFTDEHGVMEYNSIEDYLDDFKIIRNQNRLKLLKHELSEMLFEYDYQLAKIQFLVLMTGGKRNESDVATFFEHDQNIKKYVGTPKHDRMKNRLMAIPAYKATVETQAAAEGELVTMSLAISAKQKELNTFETGNTFVLQSKSKNLYKSMQIKE